MIQKEVDFTTLIRGKKHTLRRKVLVYNDFLEVMVDYTGRELMNLVNEHETKKQIEAIRRQERRRNC